ncbi:MAG: GNAT family N-acetyltransferase [bacterium]|nr:GNAT family N-acetyltransferase [bacterium]
MTTTPEVAEQLSFVSPSAAYEADFWAMIDEYSRVGERYEPPMLFPKGRHFSSYLRRAEEIARGEGALPSGVPMNIYWLVRGERRILATCYLRWALTEPLENEGGHIGYKVRPSERRKGYGTKLCAMALDTAARRGLNQVLITCDTANVASARIIETNGGRLANHTTSYHTGNQVSRYWVDLT